MVVIGNKNIREISGLVVQDAMDKTRVVMVKSVRIHPLYKKRFVVRKKYYIHDENNKSKIGDEVRFRATKPVSKSKKWKLMEIL